jgi:hypothetical protein
MRKRLGADYLRMSAIIFGTPPAFDGVVTSVGEFEHFTNSDIVTAIHST